jgi:hypothetical protein
MRMMAAMVGVLTALAVAPLPAAAQAPLVTLDTTSDLLRMCAPSPGPDARAMVGVCEGFIIGTGALYIELVRAKAIRPWACAADTPSVDQARTAFVTWARANPGAMQESVIDGFWRAMAATYPCG